MLVQILSKDFGPLLDLLCLIHALSDDRDLRLRTGSLILGVRRQHKPQLADIACPYDTPKMNNEPCLSSVGLFGLLDAPDLAYLVLHILMVNPLLRRHIVNRNKPIVRHKHEGPILAEAIVKTHVGPYFCLNNLLPVILDRRHV